ncbi:hypothetical protein LguiA_020018 [Lonicera macranthoides]
MDDLLIEILSRRPVKSLLRFKSVCRNWNVIIQNPRFVTRHLNQYRYHPGNNRVLVHSVRHLDIETYNSAFKLFSSSSSSAVGGGLEEEETGDKIILPNVAVNVALYSLAYDSWRQVLCGISNPPTTSPGLSALIIPWNVQEVAQLIVYDSDLVALARATREKKAKNISQDDGKVVSSI